MPEFVRLIKTGRPNLTIPGRTKLRALLDARHDKVVQGIKESLPPKQKVSLAIDGWTSPNRKGFLGVIAYWVTEEMQLKETLILFRVLHGQHSGESMAKIIHEMLQSYGLCDQLMAITSDNASPNNTLRTELAGLLERHNQVSWDPVSGSIRCLAHIIQLSVQEFLKSLKAVDENRTIDDGLSQSRLDAISTSISIPNTFAKVWRSNSVFVTLFLYIY
jgi:hypothetical protein